jgi:hypothetical protein
MKRGALDAARRVQSTAESAKNAAKRNPITSGTLATMGAVGGLWFASQLLGSQSRTGPGSEMLYTEQPCDEKTLDQALEELKELDSTDDTPTSQTHFENLMANWTTVAGLYAKAGNCDKAHYALGRLCYEGRGYVYDPEYGIQLYERAAFATNGGGNKDAMYALACIALRGADKHKSGIVKHSFTGGAKREYLYEAASLLRLAQGHEGARKTLSSFSDRPDPMRWIGKTREYITKAAESDLRALSQIQDIAAYSPKNEFPNFANYYVDVDRNRHSTWSGWGRRVLGITRLIDPLWITWSPHKHNPEVSELLKEARIGKDMRQKASAGLVGLKYAKQAEAQNDPEVTTRIRKEAETLLKEAAIKGDASAMMGRYVALRDIVWTLDTAEEKEKANAKMKTVLDQGVRTGSREFLLERARYYKLQAWYAQTEGQTQAESEHRSKEREDLYQAADRGDWSALESYRGFDFDGHNSGNRIELENRGVVVVPLPAALAMDVVSATVVFSSGDSDSNQTPGLRDLNDNMSEVNGGVIDAKGENRLRVTWPDMSKISEADALEKLLGAYKTILSEVKGQWVILEAISRELFGKNDPYKLTAKALLGAISQLTDHQKHTKVALCVFDNPTVVVSYDDAFYSERRRQLWRVPAHPAGGGLPENSMDEFLASRVSS